MSERGLILAVSGTRRMLDSEEERKVFEVLDPLLERARVVHVGDCPTGVDWLTRAHVTRKLEVHEAYWDDFGHRAGPLRNERMLKAAAEQAHRTGLEVLLAAFPNGKTFNDSPGTWGAVKIAHGLNIPVEITEV